MSAWRGALVITIALGFALRLWGLDAHSLWFDEALEIERASQPVAAAIVARDIDQDPPLYSVALHWWLIAGRSDAWARMPGVLLGPVTIALVAVWSQRVGTRPQALLAALMMAIAPVAVHYAGEVNQYAVVLLLAVCLALALEPVLEASGRIGWPAYTTLCAAAIATHYGLAFVVGAQFLLLTKMALTRRAIRRPFCAHAAVLGALCVPLLALGLGRSLGVPHLPARFGGTDLSREISYVADVGWRDVLVFLVVPWAGGTGLRVARLAAALAALGAFTAWRRGGVSRRSVTTALLMPLALAYLASLLGWYPLGGRYALMVAPALLVAVAGGIDELRRLHLPGRLPSVAAVAAATCLVVSMLAFLPQRDEANRWMAVPREDVRPVLRRMAATLTPDQTVYVYHGARPAVAKYWTDGILPAGTSVLIGSAFDAGTVASEVARLAAAVGRGADCWLVFSHVSPGDHELLLDRLVLSPAARWHLAGVIEGNGAMAYRVVGASSSGGLGMSRRPVGPATPSLPR